MKNDPLLELDDKTLLIITALSNLAGHKTSTRSVMNAWNDAVRDLEKYREKEGQSAS